MDCRFSWIHFIFQQPVGIEQIKLFFFNKSLARIFFVKRSVYDVVTVKYESGLHEYTNRKHFANQHLYEKYCILGCEAM